MHDDLAFHYVCTRDEARNLIKDAERFWVSNCGCREGRDDCKQSRMDLCLFFKPDMGGTGSGFKEVNRKFAEGILKVAEEKLLVTRPFRDEDDKSQTQGSCFCCSDCCGYFHNPEEKCDKGRFIEKTDEEECTHCGACADVCHFKARTMKDDHRETDRERCYGCGLCVDVCPTGCIEMIER